MKVTPLTALLLALGLALPGPEARAAILEISGSGTVLDRMEGSGIFEGDTFTFSIGLDLTVASNPPPQPENLARFEGAITFFSIDGVSLISTPVVNEVGYTSLSPGFSVSEQLTMRLTDGVDNGLNISLLGDVAGAILLPPGGFFGPGPYSLSQLDGVGSSDFLFGPEISARGFFATPDRLGRGDVTFLTTQIRAIPLPATAWLLLGALSAGGILSRQARRLSDPSCQGVTV
ncbi:MAG: hypothetical protein AAGI70_16045 [Pseudomonadota bacterium]